MDRGGEDVQVAAKRPDGNEHPQLMHRAIVDESFHSVCIFLFHSLEDIGLLDINCPRQT